MIFFFFFLQQSSRPISTASTSPPSDNWKEKERDKRNVRDVNIEPEKLARATQEAEGQAPPRSACLNTVMYPLISEVSFFFVVLKEKKIFGELQTNFT